MAISGSHVDSAQSFASNTNLTIAAFTPALNQYYFLVVYNTQGGTGPFNPSISTANGLTFVQIDQQLAGGIADVQITTYRALITSGASNGTITVGCGGAPYDAFFASLETFTGTETSGSNGSGATVQFGSTNNAGPVNAISTTLGAFGSASNGTVCVGGWKNQSAFTISDTTADAGYTELIDINTGTRWNLDVNWRADNFLTSTVTQTDGSGVGSRGVVWAMELKASGGGGGGGGGAGQPNSMLQFGIGA